MSVIKIVLTGGPCAGKTTAMKRIQERFTEKGYTVLFIPETATELISSGISPWTVGDRGEYQKLQMKLQLEKEKVFETAAKVMPSDHIIILCDRGAMDNKAYMSEDEYQMVLEYLQLTEEELFARYHAVYHLQTAAKGAEEFYTCENNSARTEGIEEARALDDLLIAAWENHPNVSIIDNHSSFDEKMDHLLSEMEAFLLQYESSVVY